MSVELTTVTEPSVPGARKNPVETTAAIPVEGWHRPLVWLAAVMAVLAVFATVASLVDHRQVMGVDLWLKPLKFALSIGVYSVTLAWLIGQFREGARMRRVARLAGTVAALGLVVEMVIIVGFAAVGDTSHFNVSTGWHAALWSVMAVSIVVVWVMTLVVSVALFRNPLFSDRPGGRARTLAIRAGALLALVGMALAFLMTGPTAAQLDDYQGIVGAHTVGVADGGPGLPLLGWSTVAGDLRIPHFVGMHALQVLPLVVIAVELASRRLAVLRSDLVRLRLVRISVVAFAATLAVLTLQAISGQSIVRPEGLVLVLGIAVAAASVIAVAGVLVGEARRSGARANRAGSL